MIRHFLQFAQSEQSLNGEFNAGELPRLSEELFLTQDSGNGGHFRWQARAWVKRDWLSDATPYLHLHVEGSALVQCQRCLQAVNYPVQIDRTFAFVANEEMALQLELEDDVDDVDLLVLEDVFDERQLIEDEILLALPAHPKHDICPGVSLKNAAPEPSSVTEKISPFAVLAKLKKESD